MRWGCNLLTGKLVVPWERRGLVTPPRSPASRRVGSREVLAESGRVAANGGPTDLAASPGHISHIIAAPADPYSNYWQTPLSQA